MARILFIDVDGAPFTSFEMLSLLRRGHDVFAAAFRGFPEALHSGELAPLRPRQLRVPRIDIGALRSVRPTTLLRVLGTAVGAYSAEPAYLAKLFATLGWTIALAHWAEGNAIDHVHANWAHLPATSGWMISRLTGIPFSFSAHAGRDVFRTEALLGRKLAEARFVVACNRAARDRLLEVAGAQGAVEKVHLCYHGVDLERFARAERGPGNEILCVGNLDPAKGFDLAIRAVPLLRASGRTVRCRIVGDGPERAALARLARELGVSDDVELAGALAGRELVEAYTRAAALAAPSRVLRNGGRDGLPNVVVEAMAIGVPVVGTRAAALPEAIEHERTGLLVPPEDPAALAAAVARLLDDRRLAMRVAAAAYEQVVERFDRSKTLEAYARLFVS